jgi:hypothetical protein
MIRDLIFGVRPRIHERLVIGFTEKLYAQVAGCVGTKTVIVVLSGSKNTKGRVFRKE